MLLRTATKFQPLVARHRKAERSNLKSATANHAIYLLLHTVVLI
ncbi:hypothetical protein [Pilibacter termitis]|nr:hypothetical protein [Pilibacter termitis]